MIISCVFGVTVVVPALTKSDTIGCDIFMPL